MHSIVSEKSLWQYLKAHCETTRITEWIADAAEPNDSSSRPPLLLDIRSDLSECTAFLRELILDELTRCCKELYCSYCIIVFLEEDMSNITKNRTVLLFPLTILLNIRQSKRQVSSSCKLEI